MLATNTPALRLFPATPGRHPIALLAHGNGGSKEMLFRFGEALAAAGFDCYSVDQAGFGESPLSCSLTKAKDESMSETSNGVFTLSRPAKTGVRPGGQTVEKFVPYQIFLGSDRANARRGSKPCRGGDTFLG